MTVPAPSALFAAMGIMLFWLAVAVAGIVRGADERLTCFQYHLFLAAMVAVSLPMSATSSWWPGCRT